MLQKNQSQLNQPKDYWPMISFLIAVLILAVGYFLIYPNMNRLKELNTQIAAKNKEAQSMETKIADLYALKKAFSENQDKIDKLDLALPKDDAMAELLNNISTIGASSALNVVLVNQLKPTKETKYTSVEIGFEGSFKSLKLFFEDLEKNIRASDPKLISISSSQNLENEGQEVIKGKVELDFFKVTGIKSKTDTDSKKETLEESNNNIE